LTTRKNVDLFITADACICTFQQAPDRRPSSARSLQRFGYCYGAPT